MRGDEQWPLLVASRPRFTSDRPTMMSLSGLRRMVTLETEPTPRLVDGASDEMLPISQTEARLIQQWDGVSGATSLSAKIFMGGLDVEPWQIEQFFARLERMQLLAVPPPVVPDFIPPRPGVEQPGDRVPALRGDLVIARLVPSGEVLEVFEPQRERGFSLMDFEVSLARLLDGKRTAAELIEKAAALGIPVTLQTLRSFLQQLRAYNFIDPRLREGASTWPRRAAWTPQIREPYQRALRALRAGQPTDAREAIDAVFQADPGNLEASTLKLRLEAKTLKVDLFELHAPPSPTALVRTGEISALMPGDERALPLTIDPFASFGFGADGEHPTSSRLPAIPETLKSAKSRRTRRIVFIAAALVVVIALMMIPVATVRTVPIELEVVKRAVPRATLGGFVKPSAVKLGSAVTKGTALARVEGLNTEAAIEKQISTVEKQLKALAPSDDVKRIAKARTAMKTAQAAVSALERQKRSATKKTLPGLEKKLAPKVKSLDAAKAGLEALTHDAARMPLHAELKSLKEKKASGTLEIPTADITAPEDGVFVALTPLPGRVFETDGYGQLVAPDFKIALKATPDAKVTAAVFRHADGTVDVKLDQGVPRIGVTQELLGRKGTLEWAEGRKPWLLSF